MLNRPLSRQRRKSRKLRRSRKLLREGRPQRHPLHLSNLEKRENADVDADAEDEAAAAMCLRLLQPLQFPAPFRRSLRRKPQFHRNLSLHQQSPWPQRAHPEEPSFWQSDCPDRARAHGSNATT